MFSVPNDSRYVDEERKKQKRQKYYADNRDRIRQQSRQRYAEKRQMVWAANNTQVLETEEDQNARLVEKRRKYNEDNRDRIRQQSRQMLC